MTNQNQTINPNSEVVCKHCQSKNVRKYGLYKTTQIYFCNDCKRKFNADDHLFKMKTPANQVSSALDMYYKGMSINDIRDNLNQQYHNNPSSKTVYEWIEKYTPVAIKDFRDYQPKVGDTWIADETVLKIGGQNVWLWDIIDKDTRFLLASRVSLNRGTKDAQLLMEQAEKKAGKTPKVVITDQLRAYLDGIELAYGADTEHKQGSPFAIDDSSTSEIERFHGTIKERTKVMRGLKNMESAIQFTDGFMAHYNFLRPHEALDGKTPAEEAKINYQLKSWVDVTRMATPQVRVLVTPAVTSVIGKTPPLIRPLTHRTYNTGQKRAQRLERKARMVRPHRAKRGMGITRRSDR